MRTTWQSCNAIGVLACMLVALSSGKVLGGSTIWTGDFEMRVTLTAKQKSQVRRILKQSEKALFKALRKHGVDPYSTRPSGPRLFRASSELKAVGRRTRSQLSNVVNAEQLRVYDQVAKEIERRVRRSVRL